MEHRHSALSTAGRWARRLLLAIAVSVLGLLPGLHGLAPTRASTARAAPAQVSQASPSDSTESPPTHGVLASAATFDPATNGQLDITTDLNQGDRLFLLQASYHDWGAGPGDYYLASGTQISHQPLSSLFAPLATWLAAHEQPPVTVILALNVDRPSANPQSFEAACKAFKDQLGPYFANQRDLQGLALGTLSDAEVTTLESQTHVFTDWSACTGEQFPIAEAGSQNRFRSSEQRIGATAVSTDHWMADLADVIGQRPLNQIVIPGSHDSGTYGHFGDAFSQAFAQAQSEDITAQLNDGSRYFDIRANYKDWGGNAGADYWNAHGSAISTDVRLTQMLNQIVDWASKPEHAKEIVLAQVGGDSGNPVRLNQICTDFLQSAGTHLIDPAKIPGGAGFWDMSLNDIWALPNHPTILVDWPSCTHQQWPPSEHLPLASDGVPFGAFYANQCYANPYQNEQDLNHPFPGIINTLTTALPGRLNFMDNPKNSTFPLNDGPYPELPDKFVAGFYVLFTQGTPSDACLVDGLGGLNDPDFYHANADTLAAVQGWYTNNQNNARYNLNILAGDFFQWRDIAKIAIGLDQLVVAPTLQTAVQNGKITVTCTNPTPAAHMSMEDYAVQRGPGPASTQFTYGSSPLQLTLDRTQFPAGAAVRVVCRDEDSGMIGSLTIPSGAFDLDFRFLPLSSVYNGYRDWPDGVSQPGRWLVCTPLAQLNQRLIIYVRGGQGRNETSYLLPNNPGQFGPLAVRLGQGDFPPDIGELTATCRSDDNSYTTTFTFQRSDLPQGGELGGNVFRNAPPGASVSIGGSSASSGGNGSSGGGNGSPSGVCTYLPQSRWCSPNQP